MSATEQSTQPIDLQQLNTTFKALPIVCLPIAKLAIDLRGIANFDEKW